MLKRHVEILADVRLRCDNIEQLIAYALRLNVHKAEPGLGELVGKRCKKRGGVGGLGEIFAPAARVLRDERNFAHARLNAFGDRSANGLEREAVVAPTNIRNSAERAEAIAAV